MKQKLASIPLGGAIDFITEWESFRDKAYLDTDKPSAVWTIGYGTTRYPDSKEAVKEGDTCTLEQAKAWKLADVTKAANSLKKLLGTNIELYPEQYWALVSFVYNKGIGALERSSFLPIIRSNPLDPAIADVWIRYRKQGNEYVRGILRRSLGEVMLYFSYHK